MITPSLEQQAILAGQAQPMRITAGAGTGKTTTIAMLVERLVELGETVPEQLLGVTFTNKAAAELSDRIRQELSPLVGPGREAEVHTYHGLAADIVAEFGVMAGIEKGSSVITPTFARQLLYTVIRHREFDHFDPTWRGSVDRLLRLGMSMSDHLADPREVAAAATEEEPWPERAELIDAWSGYLAEKQRLGVVDYSDLITAAVGILDTHPDIASRIRARYRVALLDEYQDTNPAQRIMLQRLFPPGFPVIAVGDVDQTIYEWRGATPDNFTNFPIHFPNADGTPARTRRLTINRRSDQRIITVANAVKAEIVPDPELLRADAAAADGVVTARWLADAVAEADWVADQIVRQHESGTAWREIAVLFRANRFIPIIHDALVEREIPVEVANLGGLLTVPEVADVKAWLRVLHSPEDSPAALRILMGPVYRLGMGDLAPLTGWANAHSDQPDETGLDHERLVRHTMIEAIDRLDEVENLSDSARVRLTRFASTYRDLLEVAQGTSLSELSRVILDRTGAWRDIESMASAARLTARLNLYRFLDFTEEWSPLEGRPSLAGFLDHLESMVDNPADELDAARLSGEDAVALLTVHRAKGLEWDAVFLPALTKGTFPSRSSGFDDPFARAQSLPYEFRRDSPPAVTGDMAERERKDVLRADHLRQEWRTAYVAVTRARHRLYASGAHWYGTPMPPKNPTTPGELFDLIVSLDVTDFLGADDDPGRPKVLRVSNREPAPDPVFTEGWAAAVRRAMDEPRHPLDLATELGVEAPVEARAEQFTSTLFDLDHFEEARPETHLSTSVTGLVAYAACPRRFYWSEVDRLPRRPSPAARRGVEIHRKIELHGQGATPLDDFERDRYDATEQGETAGKDPYRAYLDSDYAERRPLLVEAPFEFAAGAVSVRGRIDAIYPREQGWEIVDFKSGRRRSEAWLDVQLMAYAIAAHRVDMGIGDPGDLTVSFVYLGDGAEAVSRVVDGAWLSAADDEINRLTSGIASGDFEPVPSEACMSCDFSRFCGPGAEWLKAARA